MKNDEDIAAIYYHWSAYSLSTLQEIKQITDYLCEVDIEDTKNLQLSLIRFVESIGGCISGGETSDEFKEIQKIFPNEVFAKHGNRTCGLIAITKKEIESLYSWAEGVATIYLDEGIVTDDVWWFGDPDEEELDDEEKDFTPPEIDINPDEFTFEDIDALISIVKDNHCFKYGDTVYQLIE